MAPYKNDRLQVAATAHSSRQRHAQRYGRRRATLREGGKIGFKIPRGRGKVWRLPVLVLVLVLVVFVIHVQLPQCSVLVRFEPVGGGEFHNVARLRGLGVGFWQVAFPKRQ